MSGETSSEFHVGFAPLPAREAHLEGMLLAHVAWKVRVVAAAEGLAWTEGEPEELEARVRRLIALIKLAPREP